MQKQRKARKPKDPRRVAAAKQAWVTIRAKRKKQPRSAAQPRKEEKRERMAGSSGSVAHRLVHRAAVANDQHKGAAIGTSTRDDAAHKE